MNAHINNIYFFVAGAEWERKKRFSDDASIMDTLIVSVSEVIPNSLKAGKIVVSILKRDNMWERLNMSETQWDKVKEIEDAFWLSEGFSE